MWITPRAQFDPNNSDPTVSIQYADDFAARLQPLDADPESQSPRPVVAIPLVPNEAASLREAIANVQRPIIERYAPGLLEAGSIQSLMDVERVESLETLQTYADAAGRELIDAKMLAPLAITSEGNVLYDPQQQSRYSDVVSARRIVQQLIPAEVRGELVEELANASVNGLSLPVPLGLCVSVGANVLPILVDGQDNKSLLFFTRGAASSHSSVYGSPGGAVSPERDFNSKAGVVSIIGALPMHGSAQAMSAAAREVLEETNIARADIHMTNFSLIVQDDLQISYGAEMPLHATLREVYQRVDRAVDAIEHGTASERKVVEIPLVKEYVQAFMTAPTVTVDGVSESARTTSWTTALVVDAVDRHLGREVRNQLLGSIETSELMAQTYGSAAVYGVAGQVRTAQLRPAFANSDLGLEL